MQSHTVYYISDKKQQGFPIRRLGSGFQVIILKSENLSELNWCRWESPGCLVCESSNNWFAREVLRSLRANWLNLPTLLFCVSRGTGTEMSATVRDYSLVADDGLNLEEIRDQLRCLIEQDLAGDPSGFSFRQRFGSLRRQERKVLRLVLEGMDSRAIAQRLGIRYQTVDKYRRSALQKMQLPNVVVFLRFFYSFIFPSVQFRTQGARSSNAV